MLEPEKRRISQEVAAILESADTQSAESLSAVQAEGLQSSFCDYWPQAKKAPGASPAMMRTMPPPPWRRGSRPTTVTKIGSS